MDMHADCEEFCRSPLHPGPCKGQKQGSGTSMPVGGSGPRRDAPGPKKATAAPAAPGRTAGQAKQVEAARGIARGVPGLDAGKYGAALANDLKRAKTQEQRDQVITSASLELGRVIANDSGRNLSPAMRRKLAKFLAVRVNDAIRSGNANRITELREKLGKDMRDQDVNFLGDGRAMAGETEEFARSGRWRGMLAPIGKPTGDGRMFAADALTNRDLPLPLRFQRQDGGGHGGAVVVGRILAIEYRDDHAFAEGDWLNEQITPEVAEAKEWTRQGVIGPSVDLDDAVMELVPVDATAAAAEAAAAEACGCDDAHAVKEMADQPMIKLVTKGRISGATLVQIPAFAECAALELSDESDWEDSLLAAGLNFAAGDPVTVIGEDDRPDEVAYFVTETPDHEWVTVVRESGEVEQVHAARIVTAAGEEADAWSDALLAGATPTAPPADWFADPKLSQPTALTITEDGRVFGHLAKWGTCHVGLPGCTTPPRSHSNYAFFHTGEVITEEGRSVEVGKITLGTGHADPNAGFRAAADHYDNSGATVAVVRAGDDAYGIWVAGALTDRERVAELRRSPLSGDWRRIGNGLELVAALAVNVPGFPVPRSRVASGQPMSLVAAGALDVNARKKAADQGAAMPDGRYPIRNEEELRKAINLRNHGDDPEAVKAHIRKRAKALGKEDMLPKEWALDTEPEAVFRKMMKRRKRFQAMDYAFQEAEEEMARERVEKAAALLLMLEEER